MAGGQAVGQTGGQEQLEDYILVTVTVAVEHGELEVQVSGMPNGQYLESGSGAAGKIS